MSDRRTHAARMLDKADVWERWQLSSLDATMAPLEMKSQEPEDEVKVPTAADVERIESQARQAGYAAGQAQAHNEARRLSTLITSLTGAITAFEQQVAEDVLTLALEVARQVVRQAVAVKPELLTEVIREALDQMPYGHAVIQLNPDDASLVRLYLSEQFAHADHRIREDPATVRGGCIIETNGSQLDATLATRWKRVVESMGAKNDWVETSGE